jgi:hypothetical protein
MLNKHTTAVRQMARLAGTKAQRFPAARDRALGTQRELRAAMDEYERHTGEHDC